MIIKFDNVRAKAIPENTKEEETYHNLRNSMQVLAPGAQYTAAYKQYKKSKGKSGWDGLTNILHQKGVFLTGLLPEVVNKLWKNFKITPTLVDNRSRYPFLDNPTTLKLRDYQKDAIKVAVHNTWNNLYWPRGVFNSSVGSGKTEAAVAIYETNPHQTLFVVNRKSLAQQTIERYTLYGHKCGALFSGIQDLNSNIVVATVQTVMSRKDDPEVKNFLLNTKQVFGDELHGAAASLAKGNEMVSLFTMLPNAYFRWGLTATPFLKDQYSNWLLLGITGEELYKVSSKELIDQGYLVPPRIEVIQTTKVHKCPNNWHDGYEVGIILNDGRNKDIAKKIKDLPKPCMVLVNNISHLNIIKTKCEENKIYPFTLQGKDSLDERKKILEEVQSTGGVLITTLFDEGFDYPDLRSLILAGGGKSAIKTIQRVGRGLRKASGKHEVVVVDFWDSSNRILLSHSKKRIKTYVEQEFEVAPAIKKLAGIK